MTALWLGLLACTSPGDSGPTASRRGDSAPEGRWWMLPGDDLSQGAPEERDSAALHQTPSEEESPFLWGRVRPAEYSYKGEGGYHEDQGGQDSCRMSFQIDATETSPCPDCELALEFVVYELQIEVLEDCDVLQPMDLDQRELGIGFSGEDAWLRWDGAWFLTGYRWDVEDYTGWVMPLIR